MMKKLKPFGPGALSPAQASKPMLISSSKVKIPFPVRS